MPSKRAFEHVIERSWCKGCGICVHFCPKDVLVLDAQDKVMVQSAKDCIGCRLCELRCPDLAIEVVRCPDEQEPGAPQPPPKATPTAKSAPKAPKKPKTPKTRKAAPKGGS